MASEPMKWAELRGRVAEIAEHCNYAPTHRVLARLLADIDASAPAMERQERDAESWRVLHRPQPNWAREMEEKMETDRIQDDYDYNR